MIEAAGRPEATAGHLKVCVECREAVVLLKAFQMVGRPSLPEPPRAWVERAMAIPKRSWPKQALAHLKAITTFDSWLQPEPVGIRGSTSSDERRICCQAGSYLLDLRAEKHTEGWKMVAQLSGEGATGAELRHGSNIIPADREAIFQWSSVRPPSALVIQVGKNEILVPRLSWKRPRKK
jgi:hypothetical protein